MIELHNKKMAVFEQLWEEIEPISLPALLQKLGDGFAEEAVRGWLAEGPSVRKSKQNCDITYWIDAPDWTSFVLGEERFEYFGEESLKAIAEVRRPLYLRQLVTYNDAWIEAYIPNSTFYIPESLRSKLYSEGTRSAHPVTAGTYARQIFNRLLVDLSYNSSRLEGNSYSLFETKQLVLSGQSAVGKPDAETIMILNHKEATRFLVDTAHRLTVTEETIYRLHYLLSSGLIESSYSGNIRDYAVRIGSSAYIPCEERASLHMRLKRLLDKAAAINDPYEQSFFLLIHLAYLQAFADVNKRTARLSANIPLIRNNLVPLSFNEIEKEDYAAAMIAVYELQQTQPILDLYVFSYLRTCAAYDATVQTFGFDAVRIRLRRERKEAVRAVILQGVVGSAMEDYIRDYAKGIAEADRDSFIEDVHEDLEAIDANSIRGLGVTPDELVLWQKARGISV